LSSKTKDKISAKKGKKKYTTENKIEKQDVLTAQTKRKNK